MGSQLMDEPGIEISNSTFGEREILSNLTIIMADPSDAGGYACNATNAAGQDTAAAELTVHGKSTWLPGFFEKFVSSFKVAVLVFIRIN